MGVMDRLVLTDSGWDRMAPLIIGRIQPVVATPRNWRLCSWLVNAHPTDAPEENCVHPGVRLRGSVKITAVSGRRLPKGARAKRPLPMRAFQRRLAHAGFGVREVCRQHIWRLQRLH